MRRNGGSTKTRAVYRVVDDYPPAVPAHTSVLRLQRGWEHCVSVCMNAAENVPIKDVQGKNRVSGSVPNGAVNTFR